MWAAIIVSKEEIMFLGCYVGYTVDANFACMRGNRIYGRNYFIARL